MPCQKWWAQWARNDAHLHSAPIHLVALGWPCQVPCHLRKSPNLDIGLIWLGNLKYNRLYSVYIYIYICVYVCVCIRHTYVYLQNLLKSHTIQWLIQRNCVDRMPIFTILAHLPSNFPPQLGWWTGWIWQVLKSGTYLNLNVDTASDIIAAYPEAQRTAHAHHSQNAWQMLASWEWVKDGSSIFNYVDSWMMFICYTYYIM